MSYILNKNGLQKAKTADGLNGAHADGYRIKYDFLGDDMVKLESFENQACFSQMPSQILKHRDKVKYIRLYHRMPLPTPNWPDMEQDVIWWLSKALEEGGLILSTKDTTGWDIYTDGLTIPLSHPLATIDKLYIAGTILRMPNEFSAMVRTTIHLVKNCSVPFWPAFYYTHGQFNVGTGHSFLNLGTSPYYKGYRLSLDGVKEFHSYMKDRKVKMSRIEDMIKNAAPTAYNAWDWQGTANIVTPTTKSAAVSDAIKTIYPPIRDYLNETDPGKLQSIYEEIQSLDHTKEA